MQQRLVEVHRRVLKKVGTVDYEQLWDTIRKSSFAGVYITEVHSLASQVVNLAEEVFQAAPKPTTSDERLQIDQALMDKLFAILGAAARINALIGDRPKHGWQAEQDYEVQRRRTEWLRTEVLNDIKLSALHSAKVRNTLEHFDEYIDTSAIGFATHKTLTPSLAPIDFVVSRRSALKRFAVEQKVPNLYFIRVFIASERVFVNCGHEISIQALHTECRRIMKRLAPLVPGVIPGADGKPDERGSSMLVITSKTFP